MDALATPQEWHVGRKTLLPHVLGNSSASLWVSVLLSTSLPKGDAIIFTIVSGTPFIPMDAPNGN